MSEEGRRTYDAPVLGTPSQIDAEQIRQMDGPTLTHLAWKWGLAPAESCVMADAHGGHYSVLEHKRQSHACDALSGHEWRPYDDLRDANAVFRSLRARGWRTVIFGGPEEEEGRPSPSSGYIEATPRSLEQTKMIRCFFDNGCEENECVALLRCAVLAVASEQKEL